MKDIFPFSANGVYAYKLNPDKDLINYEKPTRLQKIWKVATSPDQEIHYYSFVRFFPNYDFEDEGLVLQNYSIGLESMRGEVLGLIDYLYKRTPYPKIDKFIIKANEVFFKANSIDFHGILNEGILTLYFDTGNKKNIQQYRFVPANKYKL